MKSIKRINDYNVKRVHFESREIQCYCPWGGDWCTHKFIVDAKVGRYIFDFYVLDDWISKNIKGQELTMEQSAHKLYSYILAEIEPDELSVKEYNKQGGYIVEI